MDINNISMNAIPSFLIGMTKLKEYCDKYNLDFDIVLRILRKMNVVTHKHKNDYFVKKDTIEIALASYFEYKDQKAIEKKLKAKKRAALYKQFKEEMLTKEKNSNKEYNSDLPL